MLAATFQPAPPLPHALGMFGLGAAPILGPRDILIVTRALLDPAHRDQMIAMLTKEIGPGKTRDMVAEVDASASAFDARMRREARLAPGSVPLSGVFDSLAWLVGAVVVTGLLVVGGVVVYRGVRRRRV